MKYQWVWVVAIVTGSAISVQAQQVTAPPKASVHSQLVDVGGHTLWMTSAGSVGPTVVLDYGLGGPVTTWDGIFPHIASFTRVVKYHRAGYGKSEPGPPPRSFTQVATEMHAMLTGADVPGPYVLVGHSLGNGHIRAFAHLYPNDVAGMVFVDPLNARIFEIADDNLLNKQKELDKETMKSPISGLRSELEFLVMEESRGFKELRSFHTPPDVPMIVLVAGRNEAGPLWPRAVIEEYGPWIYASSEGGLTIDPGSAHYIHLDNPELVVSSIRRVVFPSVLRILEKTLGEQGATAAEAKYRELRRRYPVEYFRENDLNTLGYRRLRAKDLAGAITLFKLNVEMYPKAFNPYDSLAEAYMDHGDRELAIRNYRKTLLLNPDNPNAVKRLETLGAPPTSRRQPPPL